MALTVRRIVNLGRLYAVSICDPALSTVRFQFQDLISAQRRGNGLERCSRFVIG